MKEKKIDLSKMNGNPFDSEGLVIKATKMRDGDKYDMEDGVLVPNYYSVEQDKITKVYVKADNRKAVANLSNSAMRLFVWMVYKVENGNDWLWLNKKMYMAENHFTSINTYKKGVEELVRYEIIARSNYKDTFWINPMYFFNGSRVNKFKNRTKTREI